jgi:hypothetical protein
MNSTEKCYNYCMAILIKQNIIKIITAWVGLALIFILASPALANNPQQAVFPSPTAQADGRILYKVPAGYTCLQISLLFKISLDQLRTLNKLDENCTLRENQELLLGVITTVPTVTPNPAITATPLLPTPTVLPGTGEICIVLFADVNGNAIRDDSEPPILGGAVSVTNPGAGVSQTGITTDTDTSLCFKDLPEGDYNISMAVPAGYNPTTTTNYPLKLIAGNRSIIDFGAQISMKGPEPTQPGSAGGRSPILLVAGALLILGGIGLGLYFRLLKR